MEAFPPLHRLSIGEHRSIRTDGPLALQPSDAVQMQPAVVLENGQVLNGRLDQYGPYIPNPYTPNDEDDEDEQDHVFVGRRTTEGYGRSLPNVALVFSKKRLKGTYKTDMNVVDTEEPVNILKEISEIIIAGYEHNAGGWAARDTLKAAMHKYIVHLPTCSAAVELTIEQFRMSGSSFGSMRDDDVDVKDAYGLGINATSLLHLYLLPYITDPKKSECTKDSRGFGCQPFFSDFSFLKINDWRLKEIYVVKTCADKRLAMLFEYDWQHKQTPILDLKTKLHDYHVMLRRSVGNQFLSKNVFDSHSLVYMSALSAYLRKRQPTNEATRDACSKADDLVRLILYVARKGEVKKYYFTPTTAARHIDRLRVWGDCRNDEARSVARVSLMNVLHSPRMAHASNENVLMATLQEGQPEAISASIMPFLCELLFVFEDEEILGLLRASVHQFGDECIYCLRQLRLLTATHDPDGLCDGPFPLCIPDPNDLLASLTPMKGNIALLGQPPPSYLSESFRGAAEEQRGQRGEKRARVSSYRP